MSTFAVALSTGELFLISIIFSGGMFVVMALIKPSLHPRGFVVARVVQIIAVVVVLVISALWAMQ